ncbi:hypothetical protein OG782_25520 [Streptomyces sp. NBC_00876]|uniref:hypothetical protein n=1 Tax=Streptomyces sp. NBC_00876 TaxID=2975853 RepID=UPI00386F5B03|nr:hypothetical protein OG782_25520 [Streptomyces sp. NBC_00876]
MRRTPRMIALFSTVVATLTAGLIAAQQGDTSAHANAEKITIAHGADRRPNTSATDWVTYADHVVVVTPVSEKDIAPTTTELKRGEGLLLRDVELRVDDLLWSRTGSPKAPSTIDWAAYGWHFKDGSTSNRFKMAGEDESRLELGHTYVMAIQWEPARCTEGDNVPAGWRGLGASSTIPFDNGVLGQGEMEGRIQSADQARAATTAAEGSLEEQMAGKTSAALTQALSSAQPAQPAQPQNFGPAARTTACE